MMMDRTAIATLTPKEQPTPRVDVNLNLFSARVLTYAVEPSMVQSMEHWQLFLSQRATNANIGTFCAFVVVLLTTLTLVYRKQSLSTKPLAAKDTETNKERQPGGVYSTVHCVYDDQRRV